MQRRALLRTGAAVLAIGTVGRAAADRRQSYAPLGTVDLPNADAADVSDDGQTAYVSIRDDGAAGFAVVDVSDPTAPDVLTVERNLLADHEGGPLPSVDVFVSGDRLLVGGPNFGIPDAVWGVLLYDVSDPANPERVFVHETDHAVHNLTLDGTTAYLTGTYLREGPMVVADVSEGEYEELARWSIADADEGWLDVGKIFRACHDVTVRDDTAYAPHLDAGTWILDVSDPADPAPLGHVGEPLDAVKEALAVDREAAVTELPGNDHKAVPNADGTVVAIAHEAWDHRFTHEVRGPGGVVLWDVSDPADPSELARIPAPPSPDPTQDPPWFTAHNVDWVGDRLYSSWFQGGVMLHDVGDPANPERLAWWRRPDEAAFWTALSATPGEFFVAPSTGRHGTRSALYTFPDAPGEQADPPTLVTSTTTTTREPTTTDQTSTTASTATATTEPTTTDDDPTETTSGGQPGLGVGAGLVGLGAGAWLAARRRR